MMYWLRKAYKFEDPFTTAIYVRRLWLNKSSGKINNTDKFINNSRASTTYCGKLN